MCGEQAVAVAVASGNHHPPLAPLGPLWPPGMWLISLEPHVASSGRCLCTTPGKGQPRSSVPGMEMAPTSAFP